MDEFIGRSLGPYQITDRLGQGGMATVFKAFQPALQRFVAVKILPPHLAQDPQFSERFTREARSIARLDHPNILPVYDFGQAEGLTYIIMKYVEGGTLKDLLERGRMPFDQTAMLVQQIASALDFAHGQGIVHRDIKPANVLLARPDWALLSDFGLAKVAEATVKLTGTGMGMGTPEYMAPEQAHGLETDARADIYALGVTLYAMVTGQVPYSGSTPIEVILKHVNDPLPSARAVNPNLPPAAEAAILKAMSKRPEDRQQTVGELSRQFSQGLRSGPVVGATRLETPAGATMLEPQVTGQPGGTVIDAAGGLSGGRPAPGRGATVLEAGSYPGATQAPPAGWTPAGGITSPPAAPAAARRGGLPWMWIGVAVFAFICVGLLGGMGLLGGLFAAFGGGGTATPQSTGTPGDSGLTSLPPTAAAATVKVVSRPEGADAIDLFSILQQPISDMVSPGTLNYSAVVSTEDTVDIGPYWCAVDATTLDKNWAMLTFRIEVDGQPVDMSALRVGDYSDGTCRGYFSQATGWTQGQHKADITRTISAEMNDGWCTYAPGDYLAEITITAITPSMAAQATQNAPPPLAAGQRVVDDFESDRGIYASQDCLANQHVSGGALHQVVVATYRLVYASLPGDYGDFELTADATFQRIDGQGAEYGFQLRRQDSDNYYEFEVSDDSQFLFSKRVDGAWTDLIPWTQASACHGNSGGADHLGATAVGSHFEFFCNGTRIGQADDSTFSRGALKLETGTYDATYVEATFDNVSITGR